jgi:hypothetical protein
MVRVTPDKTDDDGLFFPSLKPIHTSQFNTLEGLFQRAGYQSKLGESAYTLLEYWSFSRKRLNDILPAHYKA